MHTNAATTMTIYVNGKKIGVPSDQLPYVDGSKQTMVSARLVSESLGYSLTWNDAKRQATIKKGSTTILLTEKSKTVYVNGKAMTIDTAVVMKSGRAFVPLRFVSQTMGAKTEVKGTAIYITTNNSGSQVAGGQYYVVQSGDYLWLISQKTGVTVEDLKSINKLTSNVVYTGQKLYLSKGTTHVVKSGEYLSLIADKYGVTVDDIKKANKLTSNVLYSGQQLIIPSGTTGGNVGTVTPPPTSTTKTATVKVSGSLNVRSGAGTTYSVVGSLANGTKVEVLKEQSGWTQIKAGTTQGWVSATYLTYGSTTPPVTPTTKTGTIKVNGSLNVRSGAGTTYSIVGSLSNGAKVEVLKEQNGWAQIKSGSTQGWVSADYITYGNTTTPPTTPTTKKATVKVNGTLNIRSGAGTTYGILGYLTDGLVIDVYTEKNGWAQIQYGNVKGWISTDYIVYGDNSTSNPNPTGTLKGKIVAIDPGHGGNDVGALGIDGSSNEKTLTMAYSNDLKRELEALGAKVYMTRTSDTRCGGGWTAETNADLACRVNFAKTNAADILISVHFNSAYGATGTETYYNETNNYDGTMNPYPAQSKLLAQSVHKYYRPAIGLGDRGVRNANFYVNRRAAMPSILLEVGFVSNSYDLGRIKNSSVRQATTKAMAKGVQEYFSKVN